MATLYKVVGSREEGSVQTSQNVQPADPKRGFRLNELYEMLGCDTVEVVRLNDGTILICDENGGYGNADFNVEASRLYQRAFKDADLIVPLRSLVIIGSALHCLDEEFK